jgi:hypothetical protein
MTRKVEKKAMKEDEEEEEEENSGGQLSAQLVRCYLAGWGLPTLPAAITAAATLSQSSLLGKLYFRF